MSKAQPTQDNNLNLNKIFEQVASDSVARDGESFARASKSYFKAEPKKAGNAYKSIVLEPNLVKKQEKLQEILTPATQDNQINDTAFKIFSSILKRIFASSQNDEQKEEAIDKVIGDFLFLSSNLEQEQEPNIDEVRKDFDRVYLDISLFDDENNKEMSDLIKAGANDEIKALIKEEIAKDNQNNKEQENQKDEENTPPKTNKNIETKAIRQSSILDNITYKDIALGGLSTSFLASIPFTGPVGLLLAGLTCAYAISNKNAENEEKKAIMKKVYENKDIRKILDENNAVKKLVDEIKEQDPDFKEVAEEAEKEQENLPTNVGEIINETQEALDLSESNLMEAENDFTKTNQNQEGQEASQENIKTSTEKAQSSEEADELHAIINNLSLNNTDTSAEIPVDINQKMGNKINGR